MPTFDPSNGLFRSYWEKRQASGVYLPGVPYFEDPVDQCISSEDLANESASIDSECLQPLSQRLRGLQAKFSTNGSFNTDTEPEALAYWFAALQGKGRTPTVLTGGQSWRHVLAPSETDITFPFSRSARVSRDDGRIQTFLNVQPSSISISTAVRALLTSAVDLLFERSTYYDLASVDVEGTPLSANARPFLRGNPTYGQLGGTPTGAPTIHVRVTAGPQWETKLGDSGTWDDITPEDGGWVDVLDGSGNPVGDAGSRVQLYIASAAAVAVNDEWTFELTDLSGWAAALPVVPSLNEVEASIELDGAAFKATSASVTYERPIEPDENIGGLYADGIRRAGKRVVSGALDTRYIDTGIRDRLEKGSPFSLEFIGLSGTNIGSSSDPYRLSSYHPLCVLTGRPATTAGSSEYNQAAAFACYYDSGDALPDDGTITVDNGISDLTV